MCSCVTPPSLRTLIVSRSDEHNSHASESSAGDAAKPLQSGGALGVPAEPHEAPDTPGGTTPTGACVRAVLVALYPTRVSRLTRLVPVTVYLRSASIQGFAILTSGNKGVEYRVDLHLSDGSTVRVERRYSDLRCVVTSLPWCGMSSQATDAFIHVTTVVSVVCRWVALSRSLYTALVTRHQQEMVTLPRFPSRKLLWTRNLDAIANARLTSLSAFVKCVVESATMAVGVRLVNNETLRKEGLEADVVM